MQSALVIGIPVLALGGLAVWVIGLAVWVLRSPRVGEDEPQPASPTPSDLRSVVPRRTLGGYDRREVRRLLTTTAASYETVARERDKLRVGLGRLREELGDLRAQVNEIPTMRDKIEQLEGELADYRALDRRLRSALLAAERIAETLKEKARRESEAALRKARIKANEIVSAAESESRRKKVEIDRLRAVESGIRASLRDLLAASLAQLEGEADESGLEPPAEGRVKADLAPALHPWRR